MKRNKLLLYIVISSILMIGLVSAVETIGTKKQNQCIDLIQTCSNCTYVNISSVLYPNSSTALTQVSMTQDGVIYNYSFCSTSELGEYIVNTFGDDDGVVTVSSYTFEVTPSGKLAKIADSILYNLFVIMLFGVILTLTFFVFIMPNTNERDNGGFETKVIRMKYIRVIFIALIYALTIVLLNLLNGLAVNFSSLSMFWNLLGFLFEIMLRLAWPFTVILIAWIVVMLIHDSNLSKKLKIIEIDPFKNV